MTSLVHETPFGPVTLSASPDGLTRLRFGRRTTDQGSGPLLDQAARELDEYLDGRRTRFEVPVDLSRVEPIHRRVLDVLTHVEHGRTISYAELARAAGLVDDGPRRAGAACARNPVLVVVPCHRVVATSGALTGYAAGLSLKKALLALESGQSMMDTVAPTR